MYRQSLESYSQFSENSAAAVLKPSTPSRSSPIVPRKDGFLKKEGLSSRFACVLFDYVCLTANGHDF